MCVNEKVRGLCCSICLVLAMPCSCEEEQRQLSRNSSLHMGTTVTVTSPCCERLVFDIFEKVDSQMSEWKADSPLSAVNASAGKQPVQVPVALFETIEDALQVARQTNGAFDPTWAAMWNLWDFTDSTIPEAEEVTSKLPLVDWEAVVLNKTSSTVFLPREGMAIGLGGIAKGVAMDQARDALLQHGVVDFLIVAGGQVLANGTNNGSPWQVGIRTPDDDVDEFVFVLQAENTCISTSADYEKFFEVDGVRYHHIIDPRTGYPARGMRSVTVVTPNATVADALSTALFVMGPEKAIELVESLQDVEALIINNDGSVVQSSGMHVE